VRLTSRNSLVAHEESSQVVVRMERIHDLGELIALSRVPLRSTLVDLRVERIKVQPDIDTSIRKCLHAVVVLALGIDMVHADRVHANRLHEGSIGGALRCGDERVIGNELVRHTCHSYQPHSLPNNCAEHTLDVELITIAGEELGPLCRDSRNSIDARNRGRQSQRQSRKHCGVLCCVRWNGLSTT
jgi:hypothetical protein